VIVLLNDMNRGVPPPSAGESALYLQTSPFSGDGAVRERTR
jgi:hypothetical protein